MFNTVHVHEDLTYSKYRYKSSSLEPQSRKCVFVECDNCHQVMEREFRNIFRKHQCPIVVGNNKKCFKCKEWKDLSFFNKSKNLSGGVSKICRECYHKLDSVKRCEANRKTRLKFSFENNFSLYLRQRNSSIKSNCKKNGIEFNLDEKFLLDLWNSQNGICYYSSLPMKAEGKIKGFQGWQTPSLDRKTPSLGYVKGNVVWCCFAVNSFKQNLTTEEFFEKLKSIKWNL